MKFKKLTLSDFDTIRTYLGDNPLRICDFTAGTSVMWRNFFDTEYAVWEGVLVFRINHFGQRAYSIPPCPALSSAISHILVTEEKILLINVGEGDLELLRRDFCVLSSSVDRDWQDYLYNAQSFKGYAGKKLSGQRNHVNKFRRLYPDARVEMICESNIKDVKTLHARLCASAGGGKTAEEERRIVDEVLENYGAYRPLGIVLYVNDTPAAFEIGEAVGDTLYAHIEKADISFHGAYQVIASEFVKKFADGGIVFLNREEDTGDEGLRKSKLSYQPIRLIEKNSVVLQKNN